MILTCPECHARYAIADDVIPISGREVKCSNCLHQWHVIPDGREQPQEQSSKDRDVDGIVTVDSGGDPITPSGGFGSQSKENKKVVLSEATIVVRSAPIALIAASLGEEIQQFREKIRGDNELSLDSKQMVYSFIDKLENNIAGLLTRLPTSGEDVELSAEVVSKTWLAEFKDGISDELSDLTCPKTVAGTALPSSVILGCTAVGALLGQPIAGAVVGGLITSKMSADQAIKRLGSSSEKAE